MAKIWFNHLTSRANVTNALTREISSMQKNCTQLRRTSHTQIKKKHCNEENKCSLQIVQSRCNTTVKEYWHIIVTHAIGGHPSRY